LEDILQKKALVEILPPQIGDVPQTYADIQKAQKLLNYQPKVDLREGLRYFTEWLASSPSFHA
jgi:UDP-glucuronate 4-epimerase